jgi:hypothetical protein
MRLRGWCIGVVVASTGALAACSSGTIDSSQLDDGNPNTSTSDAGAAKHADAGKDSASNVAPSVDANTGSSDIDANTATTEPDANTQTTIPTSLPDMSVISGLAIPLDGSGVVGASSYVWKQTSGTSVTLSNANTATASAMIPSSMAAGSKLTFQLTYELNGTSTILAQNVTISTPSFENFLPNVTSSQIINTTGLNFNADGLWVISFPNGFPTSTMKVTGMASLFDPTGKFLKSYNINGVSDNSNFDPQGRILIADPAYNLVEALDTSTGSITTIAQAVNGGGQIGGSNEPISDQAGNIIITDNQAPGTVYRYNATTKQTSVWLAKGTLTNPKALAWGPEKDVVYIGIHGGVVRVPINSDGSAGKVDQFFTAADTSCGVDGLTFDSARNMYVACLASPKDHLYIVPYVATGTTQASNTFDSMTSGKVTFRFVNPRFGSAAFGETTLYFGNLQYQTIGRVVVGLKELVSPNAPIVNQ